MKRSDQDFWLANSIMDLFFLTNKTNFGSGMQKVIFDVFDLWPKYLGDSLTPDLTSCFSNSLGLGSFISSVYRDKQIS